MSEEVTLGEVHRLCQRIELVVLAQNSRVKKLEEDAIRIKTLWLGMVIIVGFLTDWIKHKLGMA